MARFTSGCCIRPQLYTSKRAGRTHPHGCHQMVLLLSIVRFHFGPLHSLVYLIRRSGQKQLLQYSVCPLRGPLFLWEAITLSAPGPYTYITLRDWRASSNPAPHVKPLQCEKLRYTTRGWTQRFNKVWPPFWTFFERECPSKDYSQNKPLRN